MLHINRQYQIDWARNCSGWLRVFFWKYHTISYMIYYWYSILIFLLLALMCFYLSREVRLQSLCYHPAMSGDASRGYLTQLLGPCPSIDPQFVDPSKSSLWEFLRRARNFMSFPRELEDKLILHDVWYECVWCTWGFHRGVCLPVCSDFFLANWQPHS